MANSAPQTGSIAAAHRRGGLEACGLQRKACERPQPQFHVAHQLRPRSVAQPLCEPRGMPRRTSSDTAAAITATSTRGTRILAPHWDAQSKSHQARRTGRVATSTTFDAFEGPLGEVTGAGEQIFRPCPQPPMQIPPHAGRLSPSTPRYPQAKRSRRSTHIVPRKELLQKVELVALVLESYTLMPVSCLPIKTIPLPPRRPHISSNSHESMIRNKKE